MSNLFNQVFASEEHLSCGDESWIKSRRHDGEEVRLAFPHRGRWIEIAGRRFERGDPHIEAALDGFYSGGRVEGFIPERKASFDAYRRLAWAAGVVAAEYNDSKSTPERRSWAIQQLDRALTDVRKDDHERYALSKLPDPYPVTRKEGKFVAPPWPPATPWGDE